MPRRSLTVVEVLATQPMDRERNGAVRLQCTRNFEPRGLVLRIRTRRMMTNPTRSDRPVLLALTLPRDTPRDAWLEALDNMVDMVRLQNPDERFVVHTKYPGQKAV